MNYQPEHGSVRPNGIDGGRGTDWGMVGQRSGPPAFRATSGAEEPWLGQEHRPAPGRLPSARPDMSTGAHLAERDDRPPAGGRRRSAADDQTMSGPGQTIVVSVPALRTFTTLAAVVVLSVVLSVIATITVIAVMNAGVILPQYAHLNQPTQVSQLGICVGKAGKIWQPTSVGYCTGGAKFVHVQPAVTHP